MVYRTKQCSVLFITPHDAPSPHRLLLESLGFRVNELPDWPEDDAAILEHEVVIVEMRQAEGAPMLAARLRAKPRFGRRVLIALVPPATPVQARHIARESGFDEVLTTSCDTRQLIARILRQLRGRPEYRCLLPGARQRVA